MTARQPDLTADRGGCGRREALCSSFSRFGRCSPAPGAGRSRVRLPSEKSGYVPTARRLLASSTPPPLRVPGPSRREDACRSRPFARKGHASHARTAFGHPNERRPDPSALRVPPWRKVRARRRTIGRARLPSAVKRPARRSGRIPCRSGARRAGAGAPPPLPRPLAPRALRHAHGARRSARRRWPEP